MFYFAYGSNMNLEQMAVRCPGASPVGSAILAGYRLTERQYADIDRSPGSSVNGLLWRVTAADLVALDRYEGFPRFYTRYRVNVVVDGRQVNAIVYEMTARAKREREGHPYSEYYRDICSSGAVVNGIKNEFI